MPITAELDSGQCGPSMVGKKKGPSGATAFGFKSSFAAPDVYDFRRMM